MTAKVTPASACKAPAFLETMQCAKKSLPFTIAPDSPLRCEIGRTPLVRVESSLWAKLEGHNPSGSYKDRTLGSIVLNMFASGKLAPQNDTLCLVTSGSAGLALAELQKSFVGSGVCLNVIIVMPAAYAHKSIPKQIIEMDCTTVYEGSASLLENMQPGINVLLEDGAFIDVLAQTKTLAAEMKWKMLDQHFDATSTDGHFSTVKEILHQCPQVTDVVCATGTGATAAGLMKHLPDHVNVHSRPAVSGSIEGLSDVKRYDNFCDSSKLFGYDKSMFSLEDANSHCDQLRERHGIVAGASSGATYWLARQVLEERPNAQIVFLCADGQMPHIDKKQVSVIA